MKSNLEETLAFQIRAARLPAPEREFVFAPPRKWRFDFAWQDCHIAAECEGGIWSDGAHVRGLHFQSDCRKYNQAALSGWRVFRFTREMIENGEALDTLIKALNR